MSAETKIAQLVEKEIGKITGLPTEVKIKKSFGPRLGKACFEVNCKSPTGVNLGQYHITAVPIQGPSVMPSHFFNGGGTGIFQTFGDQSLNSLIKKIDRREEWMYKQACKIIPLKRNYG